MSGGQCEVVRAETEDLNSFVDRGARVVAALRTVFDQVAGARAGVVGQMGGAEVPPAGAARPLGGDDPLAELIAEATLSNAFVDEISSALATASSEGVGGLVPAEAIDVALALAGLDTLGPDRSFATDRDLVEALAIRGELRAIVAAGSGGPDHLQATMVGLALEEYLDGLDGTRAAAAADVLVDYGIDLQANLDPEHPDARGRRAAATMLVTQGLLLSPGDRGGLVDDLADRWVPTADGGQALALSLVVDALDLEQTNDDLSVVGLGAGPWQRANQPFVRQAVLADLVAGSHSGDATISPGGQRLVNDVLDRYPDVVELSADSWHDIDMDDRYQDTADGRACRVWPTTGLRAVLASALAAPNYGLDDADYEAALALDRFDEDLASGSASAEELDLLWLQREILIEGLASDPAEAALIVEAMGRGLSAAEALRLVRAAAEPELTDARVRRLRLVVDTNAWGDPVPLDEVDPAVLPPAVARSLGGELGVLQNVQLARFAEGRVVPEMPLTDEQVELVARYDEVATWFYHRFAWGWPGGAEEAVDHLRTMDADELERIFGEVPEGFGDLLDELGEPGNQVVWDLMAGASGNDTFLGPGGTFRPADGRNVTSADPQALLVQLAILREVGPYQELLDGDGSGVIHEDEVERWLEAARNDPSIPPALVDRVAVGAGFGLGEDTFGWDEIAAIIGVVGLAAAVTATIVFSGGTAAPLWVQGGLVGLAALEGYAAYRAGDNVGAVLAGAGGLADIAAAARLLRAARVAPVGDVAPAARAIDEHPDLVDLARRSDDADLRALAGEADDLTPTEFTSRYQAILDRQQTRIVDDLLEEGVEPAQVALLLREAEVEPVLAPGRIGHALDGNVRNNAARDGSGGHYARSPNVRVVTRSEPDVNGVTTGTIQIRDPETGRWRDKPIDQPHSFFPEHWTRRQAELEIEHAFRNAKPDATGRFWTGTASDGTRIRGRYVDAADPELGWTSAYPLFTRRRRP